MAEQQPHPWLRGPVDGVPRELQPVAHALVQTREEVDEFTAGFPDDLLWEGVAGLAPVGYHLKHIAGVIDRATLRDAMLHGVAGSARWSGAGGVSTTTTASGAARKICPGRAKRSGR